MRKVVHFEIPADDESRAVHDRDDDPGGRADPAPDAALWKSAQTQG
jgi:hypothetical protein